MFAKLQRVHFIGIGGIGMSGIAEILLTLGYTVTGSDLRRGPTTDRLASLGATIVEGHAATNVSGADVVVTTSAVSQDNAEVLAARQQKIPVIQRAEMLAELMRLKYGIAVAGMHGKTTTTSMIAVVLATAGLDPTVVVGGRVDALGSNARFGASKYLVAEADESDRSFLMVSPILSVVTNLDREHMDCYRDMDDVRAAFLQFLNRVPFYGTCVVCADDAQLMQVAQQARRRVLTYGTAPDADFRISPAQSQPSAAATDAHTSTFAVSFRSLQLGDFTLNVPGSHNVLNATAAIAIATLLDVPAATIAVGLRNFGGVDRRFQTKGTARGVTVVDDYGHHPTEIRATLQAARQCGFRRIHVLFQPHRYTRTRDLRDQFLTAFDQADTVTLLDIYAASEQPIDGVDSQSLAAAFGRQAVKYAPDFDLAVAIVTAAAQQGDLVLTLGAGNVSALAPRVLQALGGTP